MRLTGRWNPRTNQIRCFSTCTFPVISSFSSSVFPSIHPATLSSFSHLCCHPLVVFFSSSFFFLPHLTVVADWVLKANLHSISLRLLSFISLSSHSFLSPPPPSPRPLSLSLSLSLSSSLSSSFFSIQNFFLVVLPLLY